MRSRAAATAFALSAALLAACGAEPKLDVQPQSSAPAPAAAQAPAEPAAAPAAAPVETLPAHAAETPAGELPAGHPPIADLPPGHPPMDAAAAAQMPVMVPEVTPGAGQGEQAIAWTAPAGWIAEPPANAMRRAQYRVPGPGGEGECYVFYFGPGQGGTPMANAERWASQFADEKGQPALAAMKTRTEKVGDAQVLFVETRGTYMSGGMMGDQVVPKPGSALLGAVVEGPDASWFFKFTGPETTVTAQRAAFEAMIRSVQHGG